MGHVTITENATREQTVIGAGGAPTTAITFEFFADDGSDVDVYVDATLQVDPTNYSITPTAGTDGGYQGGTITWVTTQISVTVTAELSIPYSRSSDFPTSGAFNITTLNTDLDKLWSAIKQLNATLGRKVGYITTDTPTATTDVDWPLKAARASKTAGWDANGKLTPIATEDQTVSVTATGSTTSRLLADRFAEIFNVKDYGATGLGVADDTVALQACLDAVSTTGGMVDLPPGTYLLDTSTSLFVKSNTWVRGSGIGATIIKMPKSIAFKNENYAAGGPDNDITISDMSFDGDGTWAGAVTMSGVARVIVERVHIYNDFGSGASNAIAFESSASQDSTDLLVTNCIIDTNDYGVNLDATLGTTTYSIKRVVVSNNVIETDWGTGVATQRWVEGLTITGNHFVLTAAAASGLTGDFAGLGFKSVGGDDLINCARDVTITGNEFLGLAEASRQSAFSEVWQYDDSGSSFAASDLTDANDAGANDWELFPASAIAGDYAAFGSTTPFGEIQFDYLGGTAGVGGTVDWEYWNGSAWTSVGSSLVDQTAGFTTPVSDKLMVQFTVPSDWAASVLNGSSSLYWARAISTGTYTTNPVMDQGFIKSFIGGVSIAGFANNITVANNTFRNLSFAMNNNFAGANATNISFCNNVVADCDMGYRANVSTDVGPTISDNQFDTCVVGISSSLRHSVVSGNHFRTISNEAILAWTPSGNSAITGNTFHSVGKEAIKIKTDSSNNTYTTISGNTFHEVCTLTNNAYSVILLNSGEHVVNGNTMINTTGNLPVWIIGDGGSADWRCIVGNVMYGARSGYVQTDGLNDVEANNIERGGIG